MRVEREEYLHAVETNTDLTIYTVKKEIGIRIHVYRYTHTHTTINHTTIIFNYRSYTTINIIRLRSNRREVESWHDFFFFSIYVSRSQIIIFLFDRSALHLSWTHPPVQCSEKGRELHKGKQIVKENSKPWIREDNKSYVASSLDIYCTLAEPNVH